MKSLLLILFLFFQLHLFSQTTLIKNVLIIDGTGNTGYKGAVRIKGNLILETGNLSPSKDDIIIDGNGNILCPGFIDSHSHHLGNMIKTGNGIAANNQGITTVIIGQDGNSYLIDSLQEILNRNHLQVNVATYTGHTTLREFVMGENDLLKTATDAEIDKMKLMLVQDIQKGSLGLSTGLEYEEAFYSSKNEVLELAKAASSQQGRYMSHIRSEDIKLYEALEEIIDIGKEAAIPVLVSHIKIANRAFWGQANHVIDILEKARKDGIDITADIYPYAHWHSTLRVLFPDRKYSNINSAELAVKYLFDPEESTLIEFAPEPQYKGMTISEIAKENKESIPQTLINLVEKASLYKQLHPDRKESIEAIAGKSMMEEDMIQFMQWPHSNICSDGNGGGHPRGYGAFTRFLGKYVREQKIMDLPTAIHKMTGLTATHLGIGKRGVIKSGYYADMVLLDPQEVKDNATFENSHALSDGISIVWVNGEMVYHKKKSTPSYPGVLIRKNEIP